MKPNKITAIEAKERFDQQRDDIVLCIDGYVSWTKKSLFYDLVVDEYFLAIPRNVFHKKSSPHPKRKEENKKQTCLKNWGVENVSQSKHIIEKKRQTCLDNWGVECSLHSADIKHLIQDKWLQKYGVVTPLSNEDIRKKISETNISRYGVENPFANKEIIDKIKQASLEKYGVEHHTKSMNYKYKVSDRIIFETGEHVYDWYETQPEPKPSINYIRKNTLNKSITLTDVKQLFNTYLSHRTSLEKYTSDVLQCDFYNKKVLGYRPDFKISDSVYLNVDGLYWHSELERDKQYHFKMREDFEKANLKLIQIHENEIRDKPDVIRSIVSSYINESLLSKTDYIIQTPTNNEASEFIKNNHLFDVVRAQHIGLYKQHCLLTLLSYRIIKNVCIIKQITYKNNTRVINNALLAWLFNTYKQINKIKYTFDLRFENNMLLQQIGFTIHKDKLDWLWTDFSTTNKKQSERYKTKIFGAGKRMCYYC
jgi:hypothetical protein